MSTATVINADQADHTMTLAVPDVRCAGRRSHGFARSPTYRTWRDMKRRCHSPEHPEFKRYGARGIFVCARWTDFPEFLSDMGEKPEGMTLDRIDNSKGYEPGNCRWATRDEQNRNKRSNHLLTAFGETKCTIDWCADPRCVVVRGALESRLRYGWSPERAITFPRRNRTCKGARS